MKKTFFLLTFLCLLFTSVSFAKVPANDMAIGGITVGSNDNYVRKIYGAPTHIKTTRVGCEYYYNSSLSIQFIKSDEYKVTSVISKDSNGLKTPQGITVGSSFDDLLNSYGTPDNSYRLSGNDYYSYYASDNGHLAYTFGVCDGKVISIVLGTVG
jgi:uncharacterized protein YbbC (DUF1343 family)